MRVVRYTPEYKSLWDDFVDRSKNATFLLKRDYMEYHADRFPDHSLIIFDDDNSDLPVTLFPATITPDGILSSHAGLTYGGFVMDCRTSGADPLRWLDALKDYCRGIGLRQILYKTIPHIYHCLPAEEDLYALFRNNARLVVRNISTTLPLRAGTESRRLDRRALRSRQRWGITVEESSNADDFWSLITDNLRKRYNASPVHTSSELTSLKHSFPDNLRFFVAKSDGAIVAASVIYVTRRVIHLQYTSANERGKKISATDVIYRHIIDNAPAEVAYFDFGTSNEDRGQYLNTGLLHHKELLGGRSTVYDTYLIPVPSTPQ